jgi:hypothetical protein
MKQFSASTREYFSHLNVLALIGYLLETISTPITAEGNAHPRPYILAKCQLISYPFESLLFSGQFGAAKLPREQ